MYLNLTMEEALENEEFKKIIYAASAKYVRYVDANDLESLQNLVLWRCLTKYNPDATMKFNTYLYTQIGYAIKNLIKKNKKNPRPYGESYVADDIVMTKATYDSKVKRKVDELLALSNDEDRKILEQRFYSNMTIKEIGDANGYSKETARRKIQQAIKKCRVRA